MAYIISKTTLTQWIGKESARDLPSYFVLSRFKGDSYRLEPLEKWLSRHGKRKPRNPRVIPHLSTPRLSDTG